MPIRSMAGIALLADPQRLRIIGLIALAPRRPSIVASELGISRSAATLQLQQLHEAGLIIARRPILDRRQIVYSISPFRQGAIMAWLAGTRIGLEDVPGRPPTQIADPKLDVPAPPGPRRPRGPRYDG